MNQPTAPVAATATAATPAAAPTLRKFICYRKAVFVIEVDAADEDDAIDRAMEKGYDWDDEMDSGVKWSAEEVTP